MRRTVTVSISLRVSTSIHNLDHHPDALDLERHYYALVKCPLLWLASGVRDLLLIPRISDTLRLSSPASYIVPYLALAFALLFITHGLPTLKLTRCDSCTSGMDICTFRSDCCIFTLDSGFSGRSASSLPKGDNVRVGYQYTEPTLHQIRTRAISEGKTGGCVVGRAFDSKCLQVSIRRRACCHRGMHSSLTHPVGCSFCSDH